jgi:hypothetical protein
MKEWKRMEYHWVTKNILLNIMGYFMGYRFITKFFAPLGRYENQPKYCSEDGGFN